MGRMAWTDQERARFGKMRRKMLAEDPELRARWLAAMQRGREKARAISDAEALAKSERRSAAMRAAWARRKANGNGHMNGTNGNGHAEAIEANTPTLGLFARIRAWFTPWSATP